jgi:glycosyltransferase involved in cell wall biosynthesis
VRNGAADLPGLLEALAAQTIPRERFEIVIGDDGSTDGAADAAATGDGWVRVVHGEPLNAYAARNRAVAASRAPVLAFCDADCRPEPDWLERGLAGLGPTDLVAGRICFIVRDRPSVWALLDMETSKDHELQVRLGTAETANLFLHRTLFERAGGFDVGQPGYGDFAFVSRCVALGARLVYDPAARVWHPTRQEPSRFLRNLWSMNRSYGAFEARSGRRPLGLRPRSWVPFVQTLRARMRFGLSLRLDRRWLGQNGVTPRLRDDLLAVPLIYLVIPYLRCAAQTQGWWEGRRARA